MSHQLNRTTFETSRAAEYFETTELQAQTGQPRRRFADVVLKELTDNALDACEQAGICAPVVEIEVREHGGYVYITVSDNGPGLPAKTLKRTLNFETRTSDKAAYRSPTRGAQGNALKTVLGIPHALGGRQRVVIEAQGLRHSVRVWATPAGDVRHDAPAERIGPTTGTRITVPIPRTIPGQEEFDPRQWARSFALFNPHASVRFVGFGRFSGKTQQADSAGHKTVDFYQPTVSAAAFTKYVPSNPISPHWYDAGSLDKLIHSHIADAHKGGRDLPLREFVRQFKDLTGTAKAKQVCDFLPQIRHLSDFDSEAGGDVLMGTDKLLAAMKAFTSPPKHKVLGTVGKAHFKERFEEYYGELWRFDYKRAFGEHGASPGLPLVFEVAVAEMAVGGDLFTAINYSPTLRKDPLMDVELIGHPLKARGLESFLLEGYAHPTRTYTYDPGPYPRPVVAAHIIAPGLAFMDRGKTRIEF
jgi:hypothetical protein